MLREYPANQVAGESRRRWFSDDDWDVIVWQDESNRVVGFQLCYDRTRDEHALTWRQGRGFTHQKVDAGEDDAQHYKQSPILIADGKFDPQIIAKTFVEKSAKMDPAVADFIRDKLAEMSMRTD